MLSRTKCIPFFLRPNKYGNIACLSDTCLTCPHYACHNNHDSQLLQRFKQKPHAPSRPVGRMEWKQTRVISRHQIKIGSRFSIIWDAQDQYIAWTVNHHIIMHRWKDMEMITKYEKACEMRSRGLEVFSKTWMAK